MKINHGLSGLGEYFPEPYGTRYCSEPWVPQGDGAPACYGTIYTSLPAPAPAPAPAPSAPVYGETVATPLPQVRTPDPVAAPAPSGPSAAQIAAAQAAIDRARADLIAAQTAALTARTDAEREMARLAAERAQATIVGASSVIETDVASPGQFFVPQVTQTGETEAAPAPAAFPWWIVAAAGALLLGG